MSFVRVGVAPLFFLSCQTPLKPAPQPPTCTEQVRHAELRAAVYIKECRAVLKACKDELHACIAEQIDFD